MALRVTAPNNYSIVSPTPGGGPSRAWPLHYATPYDGSAGAVARSRWRGSAGRALRGSPTSPFRRRSRRRGVVEGASTSGSVSVTRHPLAGGRATGGATKGHPSQTGATRTGRGSPTRATRWRYSDKGATLRTPGRAALAYGRASGALKSASTLNSGTTLLAQGSPTLGRTFTLGFHYIARATGHAAPSNSV